MPLQIDVLFNGTDIKNLGSCEPFVVTVSIEADNTGKLLVTSQGFDDKGNIVTSQIKGCPSPCRPGNGLLGCIGQVVSTFEQTTGEQWD